MTDKLRSTKNILANRSDSYYPIKGKKLRTKNETNPEADKLRSALVEAIDEN